jgi:chromosome segregation ATPase
MRAGTVKSASVALVVALAAGLAAAAGCKRRQEPEVQGPSVQDVQRKAAAAAAAAKGYADEQKDRFLKAAQERLAEFQKEMDQLGEEAKAKGKEAQAEFEQLKAKLEPQIAAVKEALAKAKEEGSEKWADVREGVEKATDNLNQIYKEAVARLKGDGTSGTQQ